MPDKPFTGFAGSFSRSTKPKTRAQKFAKSQRTITEERNKNLAKARRVRKKNLAARKKAARR